MTSKRMVFCPVGDAQHRAALREAVAFATSEADSYVVELLAVVPEASSWDRIAHADHVEAFLADQTAAWTATMQRWAAEFDCIDGFEVRVGHVADDITRHAISSTADLIVLSAGRERDDKATVRRVLRTSECSVWSLRPTRAKSRRLLAAVNPEPAELDLNLAIIEGAAGFCSALDGELSLMAVWELYGDQTMRRAAFLQTPIEHYHDLFDLREQIASRGLTELAEAADPTVDYSLVIENGIAAPAILETIKKLHINLLIVGTVGRAGLSGLLLGNTAEHLADSAPCSVLAIKPPGFRSPLR